MEPGIFDFVIDPCNFTIVNLKHGPTTLTLAQALYVSIGIGIGIGIGIDFDIEIDIKNVRQCY